MWVGQSVLMPDRTVGWIRKVVRGLAVVRLNQYDSDGTPTHDYVRADDLIPWQNPDATLLGARKRGKKENYSLLKVEAARANGKMPTRFGRRRGRPAKNKQTNLSAVSALLARMQSTRHGPRLLPELMSAKSSRFG
jgi:hypothetical protein